MATNDIGKMVLLSMALVLAGVGLVTGTISETAGVGIVGTIVGYITGNGVNAVRRQAPSPVLVPKLPEGEAERSLDMIVSAIAEALRENRAEGVAEQASRQGWPTTPPPPPYGPPGAQPGPWGG